MLHPVESYVTTEDGVRLFVLTFGTGPQKVVIPNGMNLFEDFKRLADGRTLLYYDLRNRGRSDSITDPAKLQKGIQNDVDDLDAVRRHFGIKKLDVIGHSYMGLVTILYAMKYGDHVNRILQIGPTEPKMGKPYPPHLTAGDTVLQDTFAKLGELRKERESYPPEEFCKKFWSILRVIYVANAADAEKIHWDRCDLPNELNFMKYWTESIIPSIQSLDLKPEELAKVKAQVLTIHGTKDRSSPYGGGREWDSLLPNARLVTVENAGHAPWIENPELVFGSMKTFLTGKWPREAEKVTAVDPKN